MKLLINVLVLGAALVGSSMASAAPSVSCSAKGPNAYFLTITVEDDVLSIRQASRNARYAPVDYKIKKVMFAAAPDMNEPAFICEQGVVRIIVSKNQKIASINGSYYKLSSNDESAKGESSATVYETTRGGVIGATLAISGDSAKALFKMLPKTPESPYLHRGPGIRCTQKPTESNAGKFECLMDVSPKGEVSAPAMRSIPRRPSPRL